jgi:hypothetical protein
MDTKQIAAKVREDLKRELPQWKFSVTYQSFAGGSSITLALVSGPEEVLVGGDGYQQLNQYSFIRDDKNFANNGALLTEQGWKVMKVATNLLDNYHWDKSDAQIDYFCCNFYMHIEIGKWNRPYVNNLTRFGNFQKESK